MSIAQNIRDMQARIKTDPDKGVELKALAVKAIVSGFLSKDGEVSDEWKAYMEEFAENDVELARLTTRDTDCPGAAYIESARAYLVGHGVCLPITEKDLLQGIEGFLDETLQQNP